LHHPNDILAMTKQQSDGDPAGVEVERRRLARLYAVLSQVNEAIVRTRDEQALFAEVCRIVAEQGEFPLAWIGLVKERAVVPVAWCGPEAGYLAEIRVEVDGELGLGPTGTCIREDRPVVNDDFAINASTSPWRAPALDHGFRASAAFPFHQDGKASGALTLYGGRPGAFDPAQVGLLKALCAHLSYALAAIAHERRRSETERALRDSEARYRAFFENLQELVAVCEAIFDDKGRMADLLLLDANDRHLDTLGLKREDVIGTRVSAAFGQEP
jgi:GAF domain-containing protein